MTLEILDLTVSVALMVLLSMNLWFFHFKKVK